MSTGVVFDHVSQFVIDRQSAAVGLGTASPGVLEVAGLSKRFAGPIDLDEALVAKGANQNMPGFAGNFAQWKMQRCRCAVLDQPLFPNRDGGGACGWAVVGNIAEALAGQLAQRRIAAAADANIVGLEQLDERVEGFMLPEIRQASCRRKSNPQIRIREQRF